MSLESELWRKGTPGKYQGLISDRQRDQQDLMGYLVYS